MPLNCQKQIMKKVTVISCMNSFILLIIIAEPILMILFHFDPNIALNLMVKIELNQWLLE